MFGRMTTSGSVRAERNRVVQIRYAYNYEDGVAKEE